MNPYEIYEGGPSAMGQTQSISATDIDVALRERGYIVEGGVPIEPTPGVILTKTMAISVAIDEAVERLAIPHTPNHPYRCPVTQCFVEMGTYESMVDWCVTVSNGYLEGVYALPAWARDALSAGTLRGLNRSGLGHLGAFGDWLNDNPWFLQSVGDTITNYGEHLTAKNVEAAIKANTAQQLTKDDMVALVAALQQGGYVPTGKAETVAQGAMLAAQPSWLMPAMIGGGVLLVIMLLKK